ncbi:unnamed protein product [Victoria cruziana]
MGIQQGQRCRERTIAMPYKCSYFCQTILITEHDDIEAQVRAIRNRHSQKHQSCLDLGTPISLNDRSHSLLVTMMTGAVGAMTDDTS